LLTFKSSGTTRALLDHSEVRDLEQAPPLALLKYPRSTAARPVPPELVRGLLTMLRAEVDGAPRVVVDHRRRSAIHESIPDVQLVPDFQPDETVFDLRGTG
jgi:hypothetical protein